MKMQTSKIHVPFEDFKQIEQAIKNSGVKFYPFRRKRDGYNIEFESQDSPLLVYLILKYDVVRVQND
jgi:hypothetical protein